MLFVLYISVALAAYLLGSVPTGYLAGRLKGLDIRTVGSGNIGATNVFRTLGKAAGVTVLAVDLLKGFLACGLLVKLLYLGFGAPADPDGILRERLAILAGICAILGHNYTCWLKFKGGKGIATTAGVMLALMPLAFAIALGIWVMVLTLTRYVSVASITSAVALPFAAYGTGSRGVLLGVTVVLGALAVYKHKGNLQRLRNGTEPKITSRRNEPANSKPSN
ncbi:MAG: glycerol-3-phosphate 1-O-acyltransferase PlsY [Verrucomicrobiota bacterium]